MNDGLGKKAEAKIREWLDKPEIGYSFDRIPDQMTGWYGSKNICDFTLFKSPYMYYIESKATWESRFSFNMITDMQFSGLIAKSQIANVFGLIIVLFASHKRAFILNIEDINDLMNKGTKSINIDKIDKWAIPYIEIETICNSRKTYLDYIGEFAPEKLFGG